MKGNKGGRAAKDGLVIVDTITAKVSVDALSQEILNRYLDAHERNFGVAFRAMCHRLHVLENTGGHCNSITADSAGGHVSPITAAGAADRVAVKRVENPRKRYERRAAGGAGAEEKRQAVIDQREKKPGGLLSEVTREGAKKSLTKLMRDQEAFARGERTAW